MVDLRRSAALLRALARGKLLNDAAEEADFDLPQARAALNDLAERLEIQHKKLAAERHQQKRAVAETKEKLSDPDQLFFVFDGGSRGNPGPSAGVAIAFDPQGAALVERHRYLPEATNNVAEYAGVLVALELALELGVKNLRLRGDSELVVKQLRGEYKVKNKNLMNLVLAANRQLRRFESWSIDYIPREDNAEADRLVNRILNEKAPKKKKTPAKDEPEQS